MSRSRSRSLSLAVAALLALAVGHAIVPHEGLHAAVARAQAATYQLPLQAGETFAVVGNSCSVSAQGGGGAQYLFGCGAAGSSTDPAPPTATARRQVLQATETVLVACTGATLRGLGLAPGGLGGSCGTPAAAAPTPTPSTAPPTATPVPATPTAGSGALHEGVPICADHDPTRWHPLVKRDASGAIACTYGHEHRDDPNAVNDIFGPPSAWYGGSQSISYPWQTVSGAGSENQAKHEGYKWYVGRDAPCRPYGAAPNDGCFISWRVQVHSLGTEADATVRFHSFGMEAVIEKDGKRGIVRHGGHLDTGHLALIANDGVNSFACPPLADNPPAFGCGSGPVRHHSGANLPAPYADHYAYMASWYGSHRTTSISTTFEEWGPIDYRQPDRHQSFTGGAELVANNSRGHLGNMFVQLDFPWLAPDAANGLVTFSGYTDRSGEPVGGCTAVGADCVPLRIQGAPAVLSIWNSGNQGMPPGVDYDVLSPQTGRSLIRFPN